MRAHSLRRVKPLFKSMVIYILVVGVILAGTSTRYFSDTNKLVAPAFSSASERVKEIPAANLFRQFNWQEILFSTIPGLKEVSGFKQASDWNPTNLILYVLTGEKVNDPLHCLQAEVPVLSMVPMEMDTQDESEPDQVTEPPQQEINPDSPKLTNNITSQDPLVAFYCTHSGETYELTAGVTHLKGKSGAVMEVGEKVSELIQSKYSIATIFTDKIHDTSFNKSYIESEKTVKEIVADNKSVKMLFDIHRDSSLPRERTMITINGKDYAKILIVVGTDARATHPKWRENMAFARSFAAKMDELYPGLSRGISVKDGRYNQQHHPSALLLEIGSINNTKEEALNSAELVADVIVALLNEYE